MPLYAYKCEVCREVFEIRHGMFFIQEHCIKCFGGGSLTKIPSIIGEKKNKASPIKTGSLVDKYIKDVKTEMKTEKKKLKNRTL